MFARIRKIIDLSRLSLREETAVSSCRPKDITEKKEGGAVSGATVDVILPERTKEISMKEKIVMIHILRN